MTAHDRMTPLVTLDHISLSRGGRFILDDVSLTIAAGEHWAILGPNGSGKTTLLSLITAYVWPTDGTVTVMGDRYGNTDIREKQRKIGMVSSALYERVPQRETLLDVILSGRYASMGMFEEPSAADQARARDIAVFLGCESIAGRPYGVLSFGERQRALIGWGLMPDPSILILDEPCEGLDLRARETILSRIDSLVRSAEGPSLLMVTHRVEEIPPGISHALILKNGRVHASGEKSAVITSENLSAAMDIDIEILRRNGRLFAVVG
jgi:iron complex transport system ATP-binding protein